jgi:hypothetical protein
MPASKFIDIDGKRFVWRELLDPPREGGRSGEGRTAGYVQTERGLPSDP